MLSRSLPNPLGGPPRAGAAPEVDDLPGSAQFLEEVAHFAALLVRREAVRQLREAVRLLRTHRPGSADEVSALRRLGGLMLESQDPKDRAEAPGLLRRAAALDDLIRSFTPVSTNAATPAVPSPGLQGREAMPEVRILAPGDSSEITGAGTPRDKPTVAWV